MKYIAVLILFYNSSILAGTTRSDEATRGPGGEPRKAQRIATSYVGADEIVFDLLERMHQPERLVAVSTLAEDPHYSAIANKVGKIKGRVGTDLESIAALRPDVVILASFNRPELIMQLAKLGATSLVIDDFSSVAATRKNILAIARVISADAAGESLIAEFDQALAAATKKTLALSPKPQILAWNSDGSAMGKGTLADSIITCAGGLNPIAVDLQVSGWAKISDENVPQLKVDWVITSDSISADSRPPAVSQALLWRDLEAVKKKHFLKVPGVYFGSTSHYVAKAVEILADQLANQAKAPPSPR
jgi:iron complex transport system substrate-binding protein